MSVLQTSQYLGVASSPPSEPATIAILRAPPPEPATQLGQIVLSPQGSPTVQDIEQKFQLLAAPWGAQAVVIVSDTARPMGAVYSGGWWGGSVQPWWGRVIVGVPIRYQPVVSAPPR